MHFRLHSLCALVLLAATLAACSSTPVEPTRFSGFLSSYEGVVQDPEHPDSYRMRAEGADWANYDKVLLAPIEIWPDPDADYGGLNITDARRLADDFMLEINRALGTAYPLTTVKAPGVLYLRIAITDVTPTGTLRGWKRLWAGTGSSTEGANAQYQNPHIDIKSMTIEVEAFDAETGERLFALVEGRAAGRGRGDQSQSWDSIQNDLQYWAQRLRASLDRAHGR